jgi:hypothetical protein
MATKPSPFIQQIHLYGGLEMKYALGGRDEFLRGMLINEPNDFCLTNLRYSSFVFHNPIVDM